MRVLLDVDGVLAHFTASMLRTLGLQDKFSDNDIKQFDIAAALGLPSSIYNDIKKAVDNDNFCARIQPYPQALTFVQRLQTKHEVIACTNPMNAAWLQQRSIWLEEVVGIPLSHQVQCKKKELIRGDVLIDDSYENCTLFANANFSMSRSEAQAFLFAQPWNYPVDEIGVHRVANYSEVLSLLGCSPL